MAEGLIERRIHNFKKTNFGNLSPNQIRMETLWDSTSVSFNGSGGNALYILVGGKDPGDGDDYGYITNVTTGGSTRVLYSSKGDKTIDVRGGCVVVGMKSSSDTCTVSFRDTAMTIIIARVDVPNGKIDVVGKQSKTWWEAGTHGISITKTNEPVGNLFIGVASMGSHDGDRNASCSRSNCNGSQLVTGTSLGWNRQLIATFIPSAATNSFSVSTSNGGNDGYLEVHSCWMFKVYSNY